MLNLNNNSDWYVLQSALVKATNIGPSVNELQAGCIHWNFMPDSEWMLKHDFQHDDIGGSNNTWRGVAARYEWDMRPETYKAVARELGLYKPTGYYRSIIGFREGHPHHLRIAVLAELVAKMEPEPYEGAYKVDRDRALGMAVQKFKDESLPPWQRWFGAEALRYEGLLSPEEVRIHRELYELWVALREKGEPYK